MTINELEDKLYKSGWAYSCWEDGWRKGEELITFPEEKYLDKETNNKNVNEVKIVCNNDLTGIETI